MTPDGLRSVCPRWGSNPRSPRPWPCGCSAAPPDGRGFTGAVRVSVQAKTKGFHTTIDIGVKYAEKQTRRFDEGKLKAGQSVIGLQVRRQCCPLPRPIRSQRAVSVLSKGGRTTVQIWGVGGSLHSVSI